jgi:hypothetical protein
MTDPTVATAAITCVAYAGLLAGHMLGDHPVQSDHDAAGKGRPSDDQLAAGAHPFTGWLHCLRHCFSYLLCQAIALGLLALLVAPLSLPGIAAALAVSGATHAVIDRRWLVRRILAAKGGCPHWPQAAYWIDQSLHYAAMLAAAVAAARVTTGPAAAVIAGAGAALIPAALAAEQYQGRLARRTARSVIRDDLLTCRRLMDNRASVPAELLPAPRPRPGLVARLKPRKSNAGGYVLVLTEQGYTTADGPMPYGEALAAFGRFAPATGPHDSSRLRVMAEDEYRRLQTAAPDRAAWADCHLPGTPLEVVPGRDRAAARR